MATTVDEIAAAAGVAKGAVYHHFATKERLFEAVLQATTARVAAKVARSAATATDIWDAMGVATEAYFEVCSVGPTAQIVLKDGPAVLGWERWREIDAELFAQQAPGALEAAMQQGLIARQPVEPLARLLLGAATEAAPAVAASADPTATGRAHADAFRALLEGLRRRSVTRARPATTPQLGVRATAKRREGSRCTSVDGEVVAAAVLALGAGAASAATQSLTILHDNDVHGHLRAFCYIEVAKGPGRP